MTLHAYPSPEDRRMPVTARRMVITYTYGECRVEIIEPAGHVRAFWSQLGQALADIESSSPGS